MKRVLLAMMLLFGAATVFAQEKEAVKEEAPEGHAEVWKWANFIILAAGAVYFLNKHAPPYFSFPTGDIQKDIVEAQATKQAAEKRAAEMDVRLSTLAADIEKFRAQAKVEMEHEAARIRQEAAHQIEKLQKQAEQEIESAGNIATDSSRLCREIVAGSGGAEDPHQARRDDRGRVSGRFHEGFTESGSRN